ncbi:MAG: tripartite tricarboxylate transporter substrate binding protein [Deferrisomatales bacterium]|nr:tripartite tricarboxylate transporter substrate binding protein [Deferrisomatales bacterium]
MSRTMSTRTSRWAVVLLVAVAGLLFLGPQAEAKDDTFPAGPVTVINPLKPGGGTDIELRNLTQFIQKYLGQPIVILSKPGAATTIGCSAAAEAKPDGYTLLGVPVTDAILAQEFHDMGYNLANFEPIYGWFEGSMDVVVQADSPYKTFADLVAAGKKKPLKASLSGLGTIDHLHSLLLEKYTGMQQAVKVPYGGGGPATAAVVKGEVDFFTGLSTTSVRFVRGKQLRQLALLGPDPLKALPDTPTIYQLGYKDWPYVSFVRGVLAPPGTPKDRVAILETAFAKAVADPEFLALMEKQGRPVKAFSAAEMRKAAGEALQIAKEYLPFMKETARPVK